MPATANRATGANAEESVLADAGDRLAAFLKKRGERVTRPRQVVLRHVLMRRDHFRADQLAAELTQAADKVSRGTVYRTLALMEEAGLVRTLRDGGAHRHYECIHGNPEHDHMVCRECGKFIEFHDSRIRKRIENACREHDFRQTDHKLVVFGTCKTCRTRATGKKTRKRRP